MSTEMDDNQALIDHPELLLGEVNVGDIVGECGGVVDKFEKDGVVVSVFPDPDTCDHCRFSEYCTLSKAP